MAAVKRSDIIYPNISDPGLDASRFPGLDGTSVCYFVDHTFVDPRKLAVLSAEVKKKRGDFFKEALLVCTCHRIEAYFPFGVQADPIEAALGIKAQIIGGEELLANRLLAIACGLESVILGEKFIYHQVAQAVNELPDGHAMKQFGSRILTLAGRIRKECNFYAADDYEGISFSLMDTRAKRSDADTLVVVGAGMLARRVAHYAGSLNYADIVMISRVAKKVRKKHRDNPCPFRVCSMNTLPKPLMEHPFDCFIGTTNISDAYRVQLLKIVTRDQCKSVIDMSSIPAFHPETVPCRVYITMYDRSYLDEVARSNKKIQARTGRVRDDIQQLTGGHP